MTSSDEPIHPEAAVAPGYLANHAALAFNRLVDAALRPHGVSLSLIGPIMLLSWKGSMLQRDLVRHSAVKQPAMVALLDKLEMMALIARSPSLSDRRAAIVSLTAEGRRIAKVGGDVLREVNCQGLHGLSSEEASLLVNSLQRLISNLAKA